MLKTCDCNLLIDNHSITRRSRLVYGGFEAWIVKIAKPTVEISDKLARGPALKNFSRPKVEWGLICSPAH